MPVYQHRQARKSRDIVNSFSPESADESDGFEFDSLAKIQMKILGGAVAGLFVGGILGIFIGLILTGGDTGGHGGGPIVFLCVIAAAFVGLMAGLAYGSVITNRPGDQGTPSVSDEGEDDN